MRDVADRAGVSVKTVSRVVNGEIGVRPATAKRVISAIEELGFRRNDLARTLRRGVSSATVGLVIGDVANPFYAPMIRAAEERARAEGSLLITASSDEDPDRERAIVSTLLTRRVDGLVIVPAGQDHRWLRQEMRRGVHAVYVDRPPGDPPADTVLFDNVGGARTAVEHLIEAGHRRIAVIADDPQLFTVQERLAGYRSALQHHGLPVDERLLRLGPLDTAGAAHVTTELLTLPDPPDAVFTTNNRMTVGVVQGLWAARRPLGLVGFDDFELADLLGVTVVTGDAGELGRQAVDLLFARLGGEDCPARRIALSSRLVRRRSAWDGPILPQRGSRLPFR